MANQGGAYCLSDEDEALLIDKRNDRLMRAVEAER